MLMLRLGHWAENQGVFFVYRRVYWKKLWTPLVRSSLRFYGTWHV